MKTKNIILMLVISKLFLIIIFTQNSYASTYTNMQPSFENCSWKQVKRIDVNSMYNVKNVRNIRFIDNLAIFIGVNSDSIGLLDYSDFTHSAVKSVQYLPAGSTPTDGRIYDDIDLGRTFYFVGLRATSQVYEYEIINKSADPELRLISKIELGGQGPVKMMLDPQRKILYVPNEITKDVSIIDIADPDHSHVDDLLKMPTTSPNPVRIILISDDVIAIINMEEQGSVSFFSVSITGKGVSRHLSGRGISSVLTGKYPYNADMTNEALFVANSGADTVTEIDVTNPYHPTMLTNIVTGPNPFIPKVVTNTNGTTNTLLVTNQNIIDEKKSLYGQGSITTVDVSDIHNPRIITSRLLAGKGSREVDEPVYNEDEDLKNNGSRWFAVTDTGGGTISWFDISNPLVPKFIDRTIFLPNSQIHYAKFTPDGHHLIATDRRQNILWFMEEECKYDKG